MMPVGMAYRSSRCLCLLPRDTTAPGMRLTTAYALTWGSPVWPVDDITINRFYHLALAWFMVGSDMGLVFASYMLIIRSVLRLNSAEATSKALSTCSSHLTLILFFYTAVVVVSVTHLAGRKFPIILFFSTCCIVSCSPALNPMVYALRPRS